MTTIDDVSTNDMNFKHLDTSKDIVITPMNEYGGKALLNADHTWTAKVSDGNNYVGDYPVTIEPNGIVVNSADFTSLPAGYYHLEIWEEWIDSNSKKQRSIYPSPQRTIDFTIYQNVTDLAEGKIKEIGFQDVVDQAVMNIGMNYVFKVNTIEPDQTATVVQSAADGKNYVTFNIPRGAKGDKGDPGVPGDPGERGLPGNDGLTPQIDAKTGHWMLGTLDTGVTAKGDKGDTGTVDNAGLTNAPAFQALQTQFNDSAVGTNLLLDSKTQTNTTSWLTTNNNWVEDYGTYLGSNVKRTSHAWDNVRYRYKDLLDRGVINTTDDFTYSIYFRVVGEDPAGMSYANIYFVSSATTKNVTIPIQLTSLKEGQWTRVAVPLKFNDIEYDSAHDYDYAIRLEMTSAPKVDGARYEFAAPKLEKGSVATDYCPNPSEILTQTDYAKIKAAIVALGGSLS